MSYEESYKYLCGIIEAMLTEEDAVVKMVSGGSSIYQDNDPAYSLFGFLYSNLYIRGQRDKLDTIMTNTVRESLMKRVRSKQLAVVALTGYKFVETLTENLADVIASNSPKGKTPALKRELMSYMRNRSMVWFCAVASNVYASKMVEYSVKEHKSKFTKPDVAHKAPAVLV